MATFSNLQLELLRLYGNNVSEKTLVEIKQLLARYFAERSSDEMDKVWNDSGFSEQNMIEWANEHSRSENSPRY